MELSSLRKSVSEMTTEELQEEIRLLRQRRRLRPERTAKAVAKSKQIKLPDKTDLAALIAAMEAIVNAPGTNPNS